MLKRNCPITILALIIMSVLMGCAAGGQYYDLSSFENIKNGHYIYEDGEKAFSVLIRSGGILGHFNYEMIIRNQGNAPLPMSYSNDVLYLEYDGKVFICPKLDLTGDLAINYPSAINPDSEYHVLFSIDSRFNNNINDIDKLIFQFDDKKFELERNPSANWQNSNL